MSRHPSVSRSGAPPPPSQDECRAAPAWDADLSDMRDAVQSFEARAYTPPVWARNAHLHTIVASGDMEKKLLGDRTVCLYLEVCIFMTVSFYFFILKCQLSRPSLCLDTPAVSAFCDEKGGWFHFEWRIGHITAPPYLRVAGARWLPPATASGA